MMKHLQLFVLSMVFVLAGCHGDAVTETVGGTVIGLQTGATVTLQDNATDTLAVSKNGSFTFPTALEVGTTYVVTVSGQPDGETCTVENQIGIIEQNIGNISSVVIDCVSSVSSSDDVYGTVSGLAANATLTLTVNGINPLAITNSTGASVLTWSFPQALPLGTNYQVAVSGQPTGQTCSITANPTGTISNSAALKPVAITCQ